MNASNEFSLMDATSQSELVARREIKAIELVDAAIEDIERLNPTLNAVVTPMYELARRIASEPLSDGPFAGVPFLLKDLIAEYGGVRFTEGTSFLADYVPQEDSELVRRQKRAGLIIVGKTNTPEMGSGLSTESRLFGAAHNPWDTTRTPGGSSGGSAAAVVSGIVPMAHGNDAGGSIRIPASCCGLFGLKPTRGRNPLGPHYGDLFSGLVAEHALTRSVRDSASLLDATSGPSLGDPYPAPPLMRPFAQEVGADPGHLRIAFSTRALNGTEVHPDCVTAVRDAAALCAELGHEVVEASPDIAFESFNRSFTNIVAAGFAWAIEDWARRIDRKPDPEYFEPYLWAFSEKGREVSGPSYLLSLQDLQRHTRDIAHFFVDHDIWLTPTLGEPPVPLGTFEFSGDNLMEVRRRISEFNTPLERGGPAYRNAVRRAFWRRSDIVPSGCTARGCTTVGSKPPTCTNVNCW
jgi:amidase